MNRNNSNHHLSLKQRQIVETILNKSYKLCDIGNEINSDPRGIQKKFLIT